MAFGKRKFMGVINDKRRLDLLAVPPSKYPFALLYFTGSKEFNINMRKRALQKGMSLSEHGLKGNNQSIQSEEDVFKVLDMEYLPPEKRLS
jgi:DNA polymerase (family 10)